MKHNKYDKNRIELADAVLFSEREFGAERTEPLADSESDGGVELERELAREFDEAPVQKKHRKMRSLSQLLTLRTMLVCVCAAVFCVCAVMLVGRVFGYNRTDERYQQLAEDMFREPTDDPSVLSVLSGYSPIPALNDYATTLTLGKSEGETSENTAAVDIAYARIRAKLEQIRAVNRDSIGWIRIEGPEVSYPVVKGADNDYYLTHAYNGEHLRSGTIMADYQCSPDSVYENKNTVLYGHNMANGAMFATVQKYFRNPDMMYETTIYFYGFDGVYVYEPVMLLDTDTSFYYYQIHFFGRGEYESFLSAMYSAANYKKDVTLSADDRLITLSTCTNRRVTGRYVLMARLVRVENTSGRQS